MSQGVGIAIRLSFGGFKSKIAGEAPEVRNGMLGATGAQGG
jgi:hypothetical protein